MMKLLGDPTFWVALSTVLCFGFLIVKAWRPVLGAMDARSASIARRLAEAEALRIEAEQILQEYKQKSANALIEADEILKNAEARAAQLRTQMEGELKSAIARQEANARARITRLENEAIESVKTLIIRASLEQAGQSLQSNDNSQSAGLDDTLDKLGKNLPNTLH